LEYAAYGGVSIVGGRGGWKRTGSGGASWNVGGEKLGGFTPADNISKINHLFEFNSFL
jgi:hypothetical protein